MRDSVTKLVARVARSVTALQLKLLSTVAAATLVLMVGGVGRAQLTRVRDERDALRLERNGIIALHRLDGALLAVESSALGYRIARDERRREACASAIAELSRRLTEAETLLTATLSQRADVVLLRAHVHTELDAVERATGDPRGLGRHAAAPRVADLDASALDLDASALDLSRVVIRGMIERQQGLARLSDERLARHLRDAQRVIETGTLVTFFLLMVLVVWVWLGVGEREESRALIEAQSRALQQNNARLASKERALAERLAEEQRLSVALAEANGALDDRLREREALNDALARSNRELDQFAYVASHDLKAPLRGIANLAAWIEEDLADRMTDAAREQVTLLQGRVRRMEALIDGILSYSRAHRVREKPERVAVRALVLEQIDLLAAPPEASVIVPAEMPELVCERVPFQQVWMNLLSNALKHAGRVDPRVEVSVSDAGSCWEFAVKDNGPGIDPRYHERIFGLFQTLVSRDVVEGTGIGLATVKKIVESRGGAVSLESALGAGATFRFRWPKVYTSDEGATPWTRRA